jgi:hypothetical protein
MDIYKMNKEQWLMLGVSLLFMGYQFLTDTSLVFNVGVSCIILAIGFITCAFIENKK